MDIPSLQKIKAYVTKELNKLGMTLTPQMEKDIAEKYKNFK